MQNENFFVGTTFYLIMNHKSGMYTIGKDKIVNTVGIIGLINCDDDEILFYTYNFRKRDLHLKRKKFI